MADWTERGEGSLASLTRDPSTLVDARDELQGLVETIWRLRQPDGCPWDRKQTHASIAKNMIEEAYEAVDCIEQGDSSHLCEELGDVLMQVVLHAQISADAGSFTMADVARGINEKLIRRHPHVFGSRTAESAEEVLDIWDKVKLQERKDAAAASGPDGSVSAGAAGAGSGEGDGSAALESQPGLLDGVPTALPALMQAQKVSRKAAAVGFEWQSTEDVWDKVDEERREFESEAPGTAGREMEFGDLLFALVNVARKEGIDAESALRASTAKFRSRWAAMERACAKRGADAEELSTEELNALWDEVKRAEGRA